MAEVRSRAYRFGDFQLDVSAYELRRHGSAVRVERRPMDLLIMLVERRGELVTRDEIVDRLWGPDVFIDVDASVNTVIRKIRRALRDDADDARFIQTVQGKGYRFIAAVESTGVTAVLAVLPFQNLLGSADLEYIADGLTEETIASLGRIDPERLSVIGRTSSMMYRSTVKPIADIARELGTDYLLEGSIRGNDRRYRVTATLIRARDQVQVWADTYDRESENMLGVQVEIGRAIAEQTHLQLSAARATTIARRQTQNPQAYDLYLRGRYYWNQLTPATVARGLDCYLQATALDPDYALAWAGIADTYSSRPFNSDTRPSDVVDHARTAAYRALAVGENVAEAHTSAAFVQFVFDWDWRAAEANCRKAVALDPNYGQGYWMLAHMLSQQGRHQDTLALIRRACELDPLNAMTHSMSSQVAFQARDFDAAVDHARQALLVEPDFWIAFVQQGQAFEQIGMMDESIESLAEALRLSKGNATPESITGYILARSGRPRKAEDVVASLQRLSEERYVPPYAIALVYTGLNDATRVFNWLNKAVEVRDPHLIYITVDPKWDAFRKDPRFAALLKRCGFVHQHSC